MRIAVIGGGGREHAIVKKIKENSDVAELYALPGNGGIADDAVCVPIATTDIDGIVRFAREKSLDYVIVAPDDPLVLGAVNALEAAGIPCFGPSKAAARIEGSKVFSKAFMRKYCIPTAAYQSFSDMDAALEYVRAAKKPLWVKADGLALGKGAVYCETSEDAEATITAMMQDGAFGESGHNVVVEEHMEGPEVSLLALTDGETIVPFPPAMDHKRALDNDQGLNTGGMGAIAPSPLYTPEIAERCMREILLPTIRGMKSEGAPFKGCLFTGLMLTPDGPKVIEYNCRFGDPETQVVLALLKTDLLTAMRAVTDGRLNQTAVEFTDGAAACVIAASGGYPQHYEKGCEITFGDTSSATLHHAGTKREGEKLVTSGGRVIGATATGNDLRAALEKAYRAVEQIHFDGVTYRRDIGARILKGE